MSSKLEEKPIESDKILKIFNMYTKYKYSTFNSIISSDIQISKFKQRISNFLKIFGEMESKKFSQKEPESVQILVKEGKDTKVFTEINEKNEQITGKEKNNEVSHKKSIFEKKEKNFIVLGGYADIIQAIAKRPGWNQVKNLEEKNYDFLYTLKNADIPFQELKDNVLVNHYWKANEITRKAGLLKNIRNLYFKGINPDNFYPRCYELSDKSDLLDFIEDFKTNRAITILKNCITKGGKNINKLEIDTSMKILKRKIDFLKENLPIQKRLDSVQGKLFGMKDNLNTEYCIPSISDEEWEIISNEDMKIYFNEIFNLEKTHMIPIAESRKHLHEKVKKTAPKTAKNSQPIKKNTSDKPVGKNTYVLTEEEKKLEEEIKNNFKEQQIQRENERKLLDQKILEEEIKRRMAELEEEEKEKEAKAEPKKPLTAEEKEEKWKKDTFLNNTSNNERPPEKLQNEEVDAKTLEEIKEIVNTLKACLPQSAFEGDKNIWIVKPGGLSRGRGVHCIDQLNDILSNVKPCNQTIIQKYIENPLVIHGRKFDLRQWVLVTDLNPLTIWLFDTPYIRFGAEDYKIEDFKNVFSQLTGNSIAKHSENFSKNETIEGDMWEIHQFSSYLKEKYKKECWPEIQEKIKKIAIYALSSSRHKLFQRKNTFEVFGFDIMIDELLNVYLIEINASPDWTYSTHVTEKLVKLASDDIMKVVLDIPTENLNPPEQRKKIDTGLFKQIYCSPGFPEFENPLVNYTK